MDKLLDLAAAQPPPPNAPAVPKGASADEINKAAREFEAMVIGQLLQPMFNGLETDGPFGGGSAEAMFRPLLVEQYANSIAQGGGIGLADAVAREMLRMQTTQPDPSEE